MPNNKIKKSKGFGNGVILAVPEGRKWRGRTKTSPDQCFVWFGSFGFSHTVSVTDSVIDNLNRTHLWQAISGYRVPHQFAMNGYFLVTRLDTPAQITILEYSWWTIFVSFGSLPTKFHPKNAPTYTIVQIPRKKYCSETWWSRDDNTFWHLIATFSLFYLFHILSSFSVPEQKVSHAKNGARGLV